MNHTDAVRPGGTIPVLARWFLILGLATLCGNSRSAGAERDKHSFGNPEAVVVKHLDLDLAIDFTGRVLNGTASLRLERRGGIAVANSLVLDTRDLTISGVAARGPDPSGEFKECRFRLGQADPILGSPLTIDLPPAADRVKITYRTSPRASGLQWLDPSRTAGKKQPFLFTQSEAIHARSWIPLQDSPGVRVTYNATVRGPEGLTAVMAADSRTDPVEARRGVFRFEMREPIAPYLIALAVGDLKFQALGERTGVVAEPSVLDSAAHEFKDVERMVAAAEARFGRYRWGRYDLLILPPSFPFGGMENPKLTFATPTILAGDRSLVALVAHELAHSWAGNQVTNATWNDFWLNEGITTYIERRIVEAVFGPERATMELVLGMADLRRELERLPAKDQILRIDLNGRDPDDGMTQVPYEKGALLMRTLEQAFGRERFDAFLRSYFDRFAFQSITTADFERFVVERLFTKDAAASKRIDLKAWLYQPGLPPGISEPSSERFAAIDKAADRWLKREVPAGRLGAEAWSTHEWLRFLQALPAALSTERMTELDRVFDLTNRGNSEIALQWLLMAVRNGYQPAEARLESFLTTIGRRKLIVPLYTALIATPAGRERARAIYGKARPFYHPIAVETIDRLLK